MHSDSDLFSALQKFIRRGMDEDVLSVGNEMCNRMIPNYNVKCWVRVWRRLHIIATEDIGVAQRDTHCYLAHMQEEAGSHFYSNNSDNREKARRPCLEAILTLCRSPKSRLTDNAYIYFARHPLTSVSEEILHQAIESKDEMRLLQLIASVCRQRNSKQARLKASGIIQAVRSNISEELYPEFESIVQAHQTDDCVLYLMHMGLLLCRPPSQPCIGQKVAGTPPSLLMDAKLLPDFVYDKHTKRGRELYHRRLRHFVEHGCRLSNCEIEDPYYNLLLLEVGAEE